MKTYSFRAIIKKDGKYYGGSIPALPGCFTFGDTVAETRRYLKEAMECYLLSVIDHADPIPENDSLDSGEYSISTSEKELERARKESDAQTALYRRQTAA